MHLLATTKSKLYSKYKFIECNWPSLIQAKLFTDGIKCVSKKSKEIFWKRKRFVTLALRIQGTEQFFTCTRVPQMNKIRTHKILPCKLSFCCTDSYFLNYSLALKYFNIFTIYNGMN